MDLDKGGRGAIERMVEAYGFTTRQALCEKLGVSKSTLATRYMRDSFPSDWVIQCSLETGASLLWLTTGKGHIFENLRTDIIELAKKKIVDQKIYNSGTCIFDKVLLPEKINKTEIILDSDKIFVTDIEFSDIHDGTWVIDIDGNTSIKNITLIPGGKTLVGNSESGFICEKNQIIFLAKVILQISKP